MNYNLFTSESVCAGHPDKICDQVSDAIVDACLSQDPKSRVAVETLVTTNNIVLAGEITSNSKVNFEDIARKKIRELGYIEPKWGFSDQSNVTVLIHTQSPEIAVGVDTGGAGDQGMMFGYATSETPQLMPLPITLSHHLAEQIDKVREEGVIPYLRPDGKTEVSIRYENGVPKEIERLIIAVPHSENVSEREVKNDIFEYVVRPILEEAHFSYPKEALIVNGTGVWNIGGPNADTGVTGRKIIVDGYGGMGRVGGGAFSGKDPTKVDRSGAYATRYLAKNIVATGLADKVEVQIAYVIGHREPIAISFDAFGTNSVSEKELEDFAFSLLDLSVAGIIEGLNLRQPIYQKTARYGHFGKDNYPWEKTETKVSSKSKESLKVATAG